MTKQQQIEQIHQQVRKGLVAAHEAMLAFKRYKKTPVVLSHNGEVVQVSPEQMPPAAPAAA